MGDKHPVAYFVAFGSLFWSLILIWRLLKINNMAYAIRYAIPTVVIFWNFVELLGRWDMFKEIWVEPHKYWLEMGLILVTFIGLILFSLYNKKK